MLSMSLAISYFFVDEMAADVSMLVLSSSSLKKNIVNLLKFSKSSQGV